MTPDVVTGGDSSNNLNNCLIQRLETFKAAAKNKPLKLIS